MRKVRMFALAMGSGPGVSRGGGEAARGVDGGGEGRICGTNYKGYM